MNAVYENEFYEVRRINDNAPIFIRDIEYPAYYGVFNKDDDLYEHFTPSKVEALSFASGSCVALRNKSWDWADQQKDNQVDLVDFLEQLKGEDDGPDPDVH